jgi:hypothetical protein
MTRAARCTCGALRAEVSGDPIYVIACHWDECQRRTGSVRRTCVLQEGASPDQRTRQSVRPSRTGKANGYQPLLPECGTPLFWEGEIAPGIVA